VGLTLVYFPRYSSPLNNVEYCFSLCKSKWRYLFASKWENYDFKRAKIDLSNIAREVGMSLTPRMLTASNTYVRKIQMGELVWMLRIDLQCFWRNQLFYTKSFWYFCTRWKSRINYIPSVWCFKAKNSYNMRNEGHNTRHRINQFNIFWLFV